MPISNNDRPPLTSLGLLIALSLGGILYVTLFPFDFRFATERVDCTAITAAMCEFDVRLLRADSGTDWPRNIVLFMPFGFAFAGLLARQGLPRASWLFGSVALGLVTSTLVEMLQLGLAYRAASLADILANTLGAGLGAAIYGATGERLLQYMDTFRLRLSQRISPAHILIAGVLYATLLLLLFIALRSAISLENWAPDFYLTLGNEAGGERSWSGEIDGVDLAQRGVSTEEAACLLDQTCSVPGFEETLVAAYTFGAPRQESAPLDQPQLIWQPGGDTPDPAAPARFGPQAWLQSPEAATHINERLSAASEFTLVVTLRTLDKAQFGPARIVSLSDGPLQRNLTVAQQDSDLIVRLRTPRTGPNGTRPEIVMSDIFADTAPHRLVLTYQDGTLRLYVDDTARSFQVSLPVATLFYALQPIDTRQMRANSASAIIFNWLLAGIILTPFGLLLLLARSKRRRTRRIGDG